MEILDKTYDCEYTTDVCVIGGAGSGLSAALRAREKGASVILLEKTGVLGGTSLLCVGVFAVESPAQKRLNITDTADECFRDLMKVTNWAVDAQLVRNFLLGTAETIRWLEEKGLFFDKVTPLQAYPDLARSTFHDITHKKKRMGTIVCQKLVKECKEKGVELMLKTRAQHLITGENGAVVGVEALQDDKLIKIAAKAVVIASGSFSANKELMKRFYDGDDFSGLKVMGAFAHNTGDGLIMAEAVGAKTGSVCSLYIGPHNHGPNHSELTGMLMRRPQPLKVNREGERFVNEGVWTDGDFGWMLSLAVDRQPGRTCYVILDKKMLDDMIENNEYIVNFEAVHGREVANDSRYNNRHFLKGLEIDIPEEIAADRMRICESIEDIAAWIGADAAVLSFTIERYNKHCDNHYDADFLKEPRHLIPLRTPPYYVIKGPSGLDSCMGGIYINRRVEVLDNDMRPIKGLYAAGLCTSGWAKGGYGFFGTAFGFSLYSGRTSGENAAAFAKTFC